MKRKFTAHFNRDAMHRGESTVWTIHFNGKVLNVEEINFEVPLGTRYRPEAKLVTKATLEGFADKIEFITPERIVVK